MNQYSQGLPLMFLLLMLSCLSFVCVLLIKSNKGTVAKSGLDVQASNNLREAPKKTFFQGPRNIAFVHVGRTGGTTIDHILKQRKGDEISFQVKESFHFKKPSVDKYDSFIVSVRNPVDRFVSWFIYAHPDNQLRPEYIQENVDLFKCYHIPNAMAVQGLNVGVTHGHWSKTTGQSCPELAQYFIRGQKKREHYYFPNYIHLLRNYEYYVSDILESASEKEIFVVRTEFLFEDLDSINTMIGGKNNVTRIDPVTHREGRDELNVSNKKIQPAGMKNLCFFLCPEIQIYKKLLERAVNLDSEELDTSFQDLRDTCPIQADADDCPGMPEI